MNILDYSYILFCVGRIHLKKTPWREVKLNVFILSLDFNMDILTAWSSEIHIDKQLCIYKESYSDDLAEVQ